MILDHLSQAERYFSVHLLFERSFHYLRDFPADTPDGRYDIDGDRLYALVQSYISAPPEQKRFEAHLCYLDIQYMLEGMEMIGHAPVESLATREIYDSVRDVCFYDDPTVLTPLVVREGEFAIFHPNDGHKPGCMFCAPESVRKVVLKVAL